MLQHYRDKARRQQDINANIDKLLAAGRDIPVELLRGDEPRSASDTGDLSKGIRNLFLGIGLLIFLTALVGFDIGAVGFILIALGCSQTLVWYLNKPKAGSVTEQQAGQQD
jgi:Flp pilus assembly protein TadB